METPLFALLAIQTIIPSTVVGLVEGRIFAHKSRLDVDLFLDAIKIGVVESKSLDLYDSGIFKRDLEPGPLGGDSLAKGRFCAKA
ncbi:3-hydroxyisobutyrate dehydrogenase-like 1 [Pyrus ussuriensis x Pyrus communis]|uniref:3-hydroxyisobutyrate dehydrogenase-like 1 n=1 Tax=Pyrus ussuriensis x Pyrus communis TaxID=2448454 RepID=A0A5N5IKM0_9ROSA|nr:3-hydroxyisobutyrate dehydrogenase-like 1 [Pyrus ussuriensis x Pyrus communis]